MTDTDGSFDMTTAPMRIGKVKLRVRDVDTVASFYQSVLGLSVIENARGRVVLGTRMTGLLELTGMRRWQNSIRVRQDCFTPHFYSPLGPTSLVGWFTQWRWASAYKVHLITL